MEGERARMEGERARMEGEHARMEGEHARMEGERVWTEGERARMHCPNLLREFGLFNYSLAPRDDPQIEVTLRIDTTSLNLSTTSKTF